MHVMKDWDNFILRCNLSSPHHIRYNYPMEEFLGRGHATDSTVGWVERWRRRRSDDHLAAQSSTNLVVARWRQKCTFTVRLDRSRSLSRLKKEKSRNRHRLRRRSKITAGYSDSRTWGTRGWVAKGSSSNQENSSIGVHSRSAISRKVRLALNKASELT